MNSQWTDTLLRFEGQGTISSCLGSSMTATRPSGAMASAIAGQCCSVAVRLATMIDSGKSGIDQRFVQGPAVVNGGMRAQV